MAWRLFGSLRERTGVLVLFDIGSGSVGGGVLTTGEHSKPLLQYRTRVPFRFQRHVEYNRLVKEMASALQAAAEDVVRRGLHKKTKGRGVDLRVEKVLCFFSSPWIASHTEMLRIKRRKAFTVSGNFLGTLVARGERRLARRMEGSAGEMVHLERRVIKTSLNGYETDRPYGKRARVAELALFESFLSQEAESAAREALDRVFHTKEAEFHSFSLASFIAVRDLFHGMRDFLLLDITAEVTEVQLVCDGVLTGAVSFPFGKNTLVRSIAGNLNTIPEEAHTLLRSALEEGVGGGKVSETLSRSEERWLHEFRSALFKLGENQTVPAAALITVDNDVAPWFTRSLSASSWGVGPSGGIKPRVIPLDEKALQGVYEIGEGVEPDSFLALESLFAARGGS